MSPDIGEIGPFYAVTHIPVFWGSTATNAVFYPGVFTTIAATAAAEATVDLVTDYDLIVKRFRLNIFTNSKNATSTCGFRDDGATVTGTLLSFGASATGEFDSGALNVVVAAGSKINFILDFSGATSGSCSGFGYIEAVVPLQAA